MIITQPIPLTDKEIQSLIDLYGQWRGMVARCTLPNTRAYHRYGGRGIKVCDKWKNSFIDYVRDVWPRPAGMSLDRVDNDGDYEPGNVKYSTSTEQNNNTSRSHRLELVDPAMNGRTIADLARETGLSYRCLNHRINRSGMAPEEAVSTPIQSRGGSVSLQRVDWEGQQRTIKSLAEEFHQAPANVYARLKLGWTLRQALRIDPQPPRVAHNKLSPEKKAESLAKEAQWKKDWWQNVGKPARQAKRAAERSRSSTGE